MDSETTMRLIYLSLLALAVGGWAMAEMRGRLGQTLRYLLIWTMIVVGLIAGYGLWGDVKQDLLGGQEVAEGGTVTLRLAEDGHFYADLTIDGQPIRFLVDTGATSMVLTKADVLRLGVDPAALDYRGEALTANGPVRSARLVLSEVALGPYRDIDFAADVTDGDLDISLLGMSYLSLYRVTVAGERMELSR